LNLPFRTKSVHKLNGSRKNCFIEECGIESFCFRKHFNGNKLFASEIGRNHRLFRWNRGTNSRRYAARSIVHCPRW
jgi:hypothetical protein